jgi:butyrate kinase
MTKTKLDRATELEEQIQQMQNRRKLLLQQHKEDERKKRTHRICKRGALLENILPETLTLTDEQIKELLETTLLTKFTRDKLIAIKAKEAVSTKTIEANAHDGGDNKENND